MFLLVCFSFSCDVKMQNGNNHNYAEMDRSICYGLVIVLPQSWTGNCKCTGDDQYDDCTMTDGWGDLINRRCWIRRFPEGVELKSWLLVFLNACICRGERRRLVWIDLLMELCVGEAKGGHVTRVADELWRSAGFEGRLHPRALSCNFRPPSLIHHHICSTDISFWLSNFFLTLGNTSTISPSQLTTWNE